MNVSTLDANKLTLLYKVILSKNIKIGENDIDRYSIKMNKLKNKIIETRDQGCFNRNRKLNIIHNVFYSYIYRLRVKGLTSIWQDAFLEYCLFNLHIKEITDINSVSHNIQKKISINYNDFLDKLERENVLVSSENDIL
jgi:hypothetical protein